MNFTLMQPDRRPAAADLLKYRPADQRHAQLSRFLGHGAEVGLRGPGDFYDLSPQPLGSRVEV